MGGDHGPRVTLAACRRFLEHHPMPQLLLVGMPDSLGGFAASARPRRWRPLKWSAWTTRWRWPCARRRTRPCAWRSSRSRTAQAQAAVSAGNTGALMALARYLLKTLDGIDRPAIAYPMPNAKGGATTVLDLGANVDCTAQHLLQFAVMGSALVRALKAGGHAIGGLAEHWRRGDQGQRHDQEGRRTAAIGREFGRPEFLRQCRRQRHFQGHDRHRRVRWLRRQRVAQDQRGAGIDGRGLPEAGVLAQCFDQAGGICRLSGAICVQEAPGLPALQRCCPVGVARPGVQEPRRRGRSRVRAGSGAGV